MTFDYSLYLTLLRFSGVFRVSYEYGGSDSGTNEASWYVLNETFNLFHLILLHYECLYSACYVIADIKR